MESPEDQIGTSRSNLVVAIHPERGVRAGGQLETEDQARRHVGKKAMRAIEAGAAALIVAFGILLLAGYMASEQLRMFTG
jgi:nickel/cobalt exporter